MRLAGVNLCSPSFVQILQTEPGLPLFCTPSFILLPHTLQASSGQQNPHKVPIPPGFVDEDDNRAMEIATRRKFNWTRS